MASEVHTTPTGESSRQTAPEITAAEKQKLIDNLQFEVTDRARKLRAQYARLTKDVHNEIERRIVRIPQSLRATNIGELVDKYAETLEQPVAVPIPPPIRVLEAQQSTARLGMASSRVLTSSPLRSARHKRSSDEMLGSDKENHSTDIALPKKRSRLAAVPKSSAEARAAQRRLDPSQVLSPKSNNSRTHPQSPPKPPASPSRSQLSRRVSPAKPTATSAAMGPPEKPKSVRGRAPAKPAAPAATASTRGRRAPAAPAAKPVMARVISDSSNASTTSAGTTVVKKAPATKKGIMGKVQGIASAARGRAGGKKDAAAPAAESGRRVLRSRK